MLAKIKESLKAFSYIERTIHSRCSLNIILETQHSYSKAILADPI